MGRTQRQNRTNQDRLPSAKEPMEKHDDRNESRPPEHHLPLQELPSSQNHGRNSTHLPKAPQQQKHSTPARIQIPSRPSQSRGRRLLDERRFLATDGRRLLHLKIRAGNPGRKSPPATRFLNR